ncbi:MAG TPA: tripartite tricarboxylate transporter substrate-binding protein [Burkholderiaceae bacterium]|nr:tripartite tricarboxylate transporter substrate-binding protein [Burkholderiaceae bacterium]
MTSIPSSPFSIRVTRRAALGRGAALLAAAAGGHALAARASGYPAKPVTIVVNFPPGAGALNLMVRALADDAVKALGQPVVIDYKAGAGGNIGAQHVAGARPDGYVLLAAVDTTFTVNPSIYASMPFDADKAFLPIATLGTFSQMLVVNPRALPVRTFAELVAHAKTQPVHYASAGSGSPGHIASELLAATAGLRLEHVPYKGNAPATQGLLAGDVPLGFLVTSGVQPHVQAGKLHALAVSSARRSQAMPDVPTVAESGYPGFVVEFGWVLTAPAGTPPAVVQAWQQQVRRTLARDDIRQRLQDWDVHPSGAGTEDTASRLTRERARWAEVTRRAGIRAEG